VNRSPRARKRYRCSSVSSRGPRAAAELAPRAAVVRLQVRLPLRADVPTRPAAVTACTGGWPGRWKDCGVCRYTGGGNPGPWSHRCHG